MTLNQTCMLAIKSTFGGSALKVKDSTKDNISKNPKEEVIPTNP